MAAAKSRDTVSVELSAVIVAALPETPRVLTVRAGRAGEIGLPSGPLGRRHRTLEAGLRVWVREQTGYDLGYVEQLYTFGDHNRLSPRGGPSRALSTGYLALVGEARPAAEGAAAWRGWYEHFPWEDWRDGRPAVLERVEAALARWLGRAAATPERERRQARRAAAFGLDGANWDEERVLERYELLYEAGLVAEAHRDGPPPGALPPTAAIVEGARMLADHRRILATAIARLRGKIKYRPLVFELMPKTFTFLQLQQTVEGLAGRRLHKPNFRRLVEQQGLVEETGALAYETGGRPARLLRFRAAALLERPAPGIRLPRSKVAD